MPLEGLARAHDALEVVGMTARALCASLAAGRTACQAPLGGAEGSSVPQTLPGPLDAPSGA
jgi:hypothetical protein